MRALKSSLGRIPNGLKVSALPSLGSVGICLAAAALAACATHTAPRRQVFQYSDLVIIRAEAWEVDQACSRPNTKQDDGGSIMGRIRCCWDVERHQMWVGWDDVACLPHELCHVDGRPKETCDALHWK